MEKKSYSTFFSGRRKYNFSDATAIKPQMCYLVLAHQKNADVISFLPYLAVGIDSNTEPVGLATRWEKEVEDWRLFSRSVRLRL